jgi:putative two-component system response regulator
LIAIDAQRNERDFHGLGILVIDDQPSNVRLLERILRRRGYSNVMAATSSREALVKAAAQPPDVVLLDLHMPDMHGVAVMQELHALNPHNPPLVIVLTGDDLQETKSEVLAAGARDFITKPFDTTEVALRIDNIADLRLMHNRLQLTNSELEDKVRERTSELEKAQLDVLDRLARAAEFRDDATGQHTRRVGLAATSLAQTIGLSDKEVELIAIGAPLHDVGKIAIPDNILLKPGPLDSAEMKIMQSHTTVGATLLHDGGSASLAMACEIALSHHERWDGTGYPYRLKGTAIPVCGRIVAIVDFVDALSNDRPYRRSFGFNQVMEMTRAGRGEHFDPDMLDVFLDMKLTEEQQSGLTTTLAEQS